MKKANKVIDLFLKEAMEKAENDPNVKNMMREGYFLCSVFATAQDSIGKWILHFYSYKTEKLIDFTIDEEITIGEGSEALSVPEKLDISEAKLTAEEALATAKKRFKGTTINILVTLHVKERIVWTVNMISAALTATTYDIDARTGEIISEKVTSLVTRYGRGG